jgi:hypothetical protein
MSKQRAGFLPDVYVSITIEHCTPAQRPLLSTHARQRSLNSHRYHPFAMGNIIVSPPNHAAVISGCRGTRILIGRCSFQFWVFETCSRLGLELMTIGVSSKSAETAKGVRISLSSTAQIKIMTGSGTNVELDKVELAAQVCVFLKESDNFSTLFLFPWEHSQVLVTVTKTSTTTLPMAYYCPQSHYYPLASNRRRSPNS